ncbi:MAG: DUF4292 domain-containing protein [Crocinitomicaceae bacterium]|nr:DUF4292 domain-containing protein [Crocinitomicaceae bacterium]
MSHYFKYAIFPILAGFLFSCAQSNLENHTGVVQRTKDVEIKVALDSLSVCEFDYFYTKISTDYEDSLQNASFKTSIRIAQDSAINAVITFVRIPVAGALITQDSVLVTNKRDKCFITENIEYLSNTFGVKFTYENVQQLIMGLPVGYDPERKYYRMNDMAPNTICSHRKWEIKRNERKAEKELVTYYTLSEDLKSLTAFQVFSPDDETTIYVNYVEREMVDGYNFPKIVQIEIHTVAQVIKIDLEYKRTRVNEEESIHFVIPESYERCE